MTNNLTSLSGINFMETMQEIFADLRTYFPSCDLMPTQGLFGLTNGATRIDQMDAVNNSICASFGKEYEALIKNKPTKTFSSSRIAAWKECRERKLVKLFEQNLSDVREFVCGEQHPEIIPLLRAIGHPAEIMGEKSFMEHERYIAQLQQGIAPPKKRLRREGDVSIRRVVECDAVPLELDSAVETQADDETYAPSSHVMLQQEQPPLALLPPAAAAASSDSNVVDCTQTISNSYITQEMADFLMDSVYGNSKDRCSWRDFERIVSRNNFTVEHTQKGNVRRIVHSSGKRFTVHRPNDERATLLHEYVSFIRSGFERVFKFSPY